jgi:Phage protein Gp138 N-terminal domain
MPLEPTLTEILQDHRDAILGELHVAMPGRVQKYYPATQTADVVPCILGTIPDSNGITILEKLPVIPNVPIAWPRGGGGFYLSFPLRGDGWDPDPLARKDNGDHVWLVFNSAAIAQWRRTGSVSEPGDLRRSTLSYPFAIPGAAPDAQAFTDPGSPTEAVIGVPGGAVLRVGSPAGDFVALAGLVKARLDAIQAKFDAHTHVVATTGSATAQSGTAAPVIPALAIGTLASVAATKLKAE